jgi:hypothetical protein
LNSKFICIVPFLFLGCSTQQTPILENSSISIFDEYFEGEAKITATSRGFKVALNDTEGRELDRAIFNYQLYQLDTADVNRDGRTDVLIGLIKATEFDPQENKRLFILRIDEGQLRPLWLGSKVCQQLVDFKALTNGVVRTLEQTKEGYYSVGIYEWQGFGLTLIKYISDDKSYDDAITAFNS